MKHKIFSLYSIDNIYQFLMIYVVHVRTRAYYVSVLGPTLYPTSPFLTLLAVAPLAHGQRGPPVV